MAMCTRYCYRRAHELLLQSLCIRPRREIKHSSIQSRRRCAVVVSDNAWLVLVVTRVGVP